MSGRVSIYDPNDANPYGRELAHILGGTGLNVSLWTSRETPPDRRVRVRRMYKRQLPKVVNRVVGPLIAILSNLRAPLVVVWVRDPWDAILVAIRAVLTRNVYLIHHNPRSVRGRSGLAGWLEHSVLLRVCVPCLHSHFLAEQLPRWASPERITPHPPFELTVASCLATDELSPPSLPRVVFLGALRPDKGVRDLPLIFRSCNARFEFCTVGPDRLPEDSITVLNDEGGMYVAVGGDGHAVTDSELVAVLKSAAVVIAPYRSVTESGSILLAQQAGCNVLAYRSPGVVPTLTNRSLAQSPEDLGRLLAHYLEAPWGTFNANTQDRRRRCEEAWSDILTGQS